MASVIVGTIEALMEIDEVSLEPLPDGSLKTVFVTTTLNEDLAKLKTTLWALLSPPIKKVKEVKVEPLQLGRVAKRVRVTVITEPIFKGLGVIKRV
jgi:hypothetical protein